MYQLHTNFVFNASFSYKCNFKWNESSCHVANGYFAVPTRQHVQVNSGTLSAKTDFYDSKLADVERMLRDEQNKIQGYSAHRANLRDEQQRNSGLLLHQDGGHFRQHQHRHNTEKVFELSICGFIVKLWLTNVPEMQ